jgi:MFS family permease
VPAPSQAGFAFGVLGGRLPGSEEQQANALLGGLGVLALPVAFAVSPASAGLAVAAFGLLIAPLNGLRTQLLAEAVCPAQRAQAFSILYAAMGAGFGASGLAAGALLGSAGARGVIALAAAITILAATATAFRRTTHTRRADAGARSASP